MEAEARAHRHLPGGVRSRCTCEGAPMTERAAAQRSPVAWSGSGHG